MHLKPNRVEYSKLIASVQAQAGKLNVQHRILLEVLCSDDPEVGDEHEQRKYLNGSAYDLRG